MVRSRLRTLVVAGIVLLAGCSGLVASSDSTDTDQQRFRLVVQNDVSSPQTVTLTITGADGGTILDADGIDLHQCNANVTCWQQQQQ